MAISKFDDFDVFRTAGSSPSTPETDNPSVLIIDDDESIRDTLKLALKDSFDIITCASGAEGIDSATSDISAVILDIKMTGKDGFETYSEIKAKVPYLPIIFHSAYQDAKDPFDIINEFRPFGYVAKGSSLTQITDTLRSAVDYYRTHRENERLIQELQSLNGSLERKVAERTEELNMKACELAQSNIL